MTASAPRPRGWLRERGMGGSVLVSAISSAFGVLLLAATGFIATALQADPQVGDSGTLAAMISILGFVLLAVAVYVAAVVTTNTFSTVVVGRTRHIALMRLIGASASAQRREVATQGLVVGALGAGIGLLLGGALAQAAVTWGAPAAGIDVAYSVVRVELLAPALVVVLTTWIAAWVGSRRVLSVTPLQALAGAADRTRAEADRPARRVVALVLFLAGVALLTIGIVVGLTSLFGVVPAFFGGLLSFTAIALGATSIMPPLLRAVGKLFGSSAPARLAAGTASRNPERSSRMAIGVVIGVTLVTMFAVAIESAKQMFAFAQGGKLDGVLDAAMNTFTTVMMALVGVSAVIAAVGIVNLLTIGVVQRQRELGLLRALGLSRAQIRRMVLLEAAHVTLTSVALGLVLGIAYGWAGAQSLLGSVPSALGFPTQLIVPAVPLVPVLVIALAAAVLTLLASVTPTRLATRVSPVTALAQV